MSGPIAAQSAGESDQPIRSRWMREYRLSLTLLVAGVLVLVVISVFLVWANSTGNYPTSFWSGLAVSVTETVGGALTLFAGTVAYYHRRGLRLIEGNA
jgi:hypothetical protein